MAHSKSSPTQELSDGAADDNKPVDQLQGKAHCCFCLVVFCFFV